MAFLSASTASVVEVPESSYGQPMNITAIAEIQPALPTNVETLVRDYFADIPIMAEVARCESTFRHHLSDGSVLRGRVDSRDTGVMQINTYYHQTTATALGLNLENFYDNLAYARNLYERQGTQPWNASRPCWGGYLAYKG